MKKYFLIILVLMFSFLLISCNTKPLENDYDRDTFGIINIDKDEIKIMQLTDIHFTYGFDYLDRKTYKLIDRLIISEEPDVIVITGDLFMSVFTKRLLKSFIKFMESYKTPWTITFGNHDAEYHKPETLVNILRSSNTEYLIFHQGPKLSEDNTHGKSNFKIRIRNNNNDLLNLYILDTKADRTDGIKDGITHYNYLSVDQVNWYNEEVSSDSVGSLAFMHIPLVEFLEYDGEGINEPMWVQGENTEFFQTIINNNKKTKGVFVGHDHINHFSFKKDDILLAYGASSGYNAYGVMAKGARIIKLSNFDNINFDMDTYLVYDYEVFSNDKK